MPRTKTAKAKSATTSDTGLNMPLLANLLTQQEQTLATAKRLYDEAFDLETSIIEMALGCTGRLAALAKLIDGAPHIFELPDGRSLVIRSDFINRHGQTVDKAFGHGKVAPVSIDLK